MRSAGSRSLITFNSRHALATLSGLAVKAAKAKPTHLKRMFFEWVIFIFSVSMRTTATPARLYANKEQKHPNEKLPEPQQLIIYDDQLPAKQNLPQAPGTRAARQLREKPLIVLPFSARLLQNSRLLLFASGLSCRPAYFGENQRPAACFLGQSGGQVLLGVTADVPFGGGTESVELIQTNRCKIHTCLWVRSPRTSAPPTTNGPVTTVVPGLGAARAVCAAG